MSEPKKCVCCFYDIPDALSIPNPSAYFRAFGFRVNLSCWVFPEHLVPTDRIETLKAAGATVHLIRFAGEDQEKILELARLELARGAKKLSEFVEEKAGACKEALERIEATTNWLSDPNDIMGSSEYKKWRGVISKAKRELVSAEQCAFGFGITRDCEDAFASLRNILASQLSLALAWKDKLAKAKERISLPMIEAPIAGEKGGAA